MKTVCVIPARLKSSRFPRKMLSMLGSKPLLQWIWDAANTCEQFDEVLFAIDHQETADLISSFQGRFVMTSPSCPSGTDRLIELMQTGKVKADVWVNWQGDAPFVNQAMIDELLQTVSNQNSDVWTLKKKLTHTTDIENPNVVKVVTDKQGKALYFSRATIPYARTGDPVYYKHIGLYAFTSEALEKIQQMTQSPLEKAEGLEQLRFMEHGLTIQVHETLTETQEIDTPEDLARATERLKQLKGSVLA